MIGDVYTIDNVEYEVVWSGGEGLVEARVTLPTLIWSAPKRLYNKKSDFWTKPRTKRIINPLEPEINNDTNDASSE